MEIKILFILGHCQIGQKKTQYEGFGWGWGPIRAIQPAITAVTQRLWHQASRDVFPTKHILRNMRRRRQTLARTLTLVVMQQGGSRCSASHLCWCLLCSELTQVLVHLVLHWVRLCIWYCTGFLCIWYCNEWQCTSGWDCAPGIALGEIVMHSTHSSSSTRVWIIENSLLVISL